MRIRTVLGWRNAGEATGHVVVIDVLRAFTTAAYAFAAGIEEIELVATPEEALARPGFRMGEVGGRLIPAFDHNNSPSGLVGRRLSGRAVQRTSAGTQGVVLATRAESLWLGSLVVAGAGLHCRAAGPVRRIPLPAVPPRESSSCSAWWTSCTTPAGLEPYGARFPQRQTPCSVLLAHRRVGRRPPASGPADPLTAVPPSADQDDGWRRHRHCKHWHFHVNRSDPLRGSGPACH